MKETANSSIINNNKAANTKPIKFNLILAIGLLTKTISKCPATILAANRTDKVKGRITLLTSSIRTIKGMRA